jgi:hypothetical protein
MGIQDEYILGRYLSTIEDGNIGVVADRLGVSELASDADTTVRRVWPLTPDQKPHHRESGVQFRPFALVKSSAKRGMQRYGLVDRGSIR